MRAYECSQCGMPGNVECPTCGRVFCAGHFGSLLLCEDCVDGLDLVELAGHAEPLEHYPSCSCCWSAAVAGVFDD